MASCAHTLRHRLDGGQRQVGALDQHVDWRKLRFEPFESPEMLKAFAQLALYIRNALERTQQAEVVSSATETRQETQSHDSTDFLVVRGGGLVERFGEKTGVEETASPEETTAVWKERASHW